MIDIYKDEKWVDIDLENIHPDEKYQISNFGRIRSFKISKDKPKILKGSWITGYKALVIKLKNNKKSTFYVHKLVALYFLKKTSEDQTFVIHLDFDKSNNHCNNLKWVNAEELKEHRHNDENYESKKIRNAKLSESDVIKIKRMLKRKNMKPARIAKLFNISHTQLKRIKDGDNWSHIKIN